MSPDKDLADFPDVQAKLQKPTKQSAFEKQKAEAEAKRQREAAETAAVYKDFIKSFDRDDDDDGVADSRRGPGNHDAPRTRPGFGGGPPAPGASRRHFGASGLKSGPGSLGPPPSSFGKKRSFQDFSRGNRDAPDDREGHSLSVPKAFSTSDDEDAGGSGDPAEEKAVARPTMRMTNLPPGLSPSAVKALVPSNLTVEDVRFQPPSGPGGSERKCAVAIVVLSQDTPGNEIESAVSALQNKYLGYGYYLSLHRHLSSAVSSSAALGNLAASNADTQPFGAKPVEQQRQDTNPRRGQQGFHRGGIAPPSSYSHAAAGVGRANILHVPVKPPNDIKIIKLINMVIEGVLERGPEFEALLMSRPEVQREEKWAWIWDARSQGGVWYRWRLWEVVTGGQTGSAKGKYVPLFDGSHAWKMPEKRLPFEYTTKLDEIVSDSDYNTSDDEDVDGEAHRDNPPNDDEKTFLNPLEKAKLTHLLARLPTTLSRLRKGDIARVSTFAIMHASRGVEEVVEIIVSNVENPFSLTAASGRRKPEARETPQGPGAEEAVQGEGPDISAASLVGLYVVSDILSTSSTSGVRHAWRFRQLFEGALRHRKVFERLGSMAEKLGWGRLRAEKWKRSVHLILNLWEGWCVFPNESQEMFVRSFENPPSLKAENKTDEEQRKGKWKVVEASQAGPAEGGGGPGYRVEPEDDVAGEPIEEDDVVGEPVDEEDVEGEPIDEDDVEGEPMAEDDVEGEPMDEDDVRDHAPETPTGERDEDGDGAAARKGQLEGKEDARGGAPPEPAAGPGGRKPRMRAVDMFADSDDSDGPR